MTDALTRRLDEMRVLAEATQQASHVFAMIDALKAARETLTDIRASGCDHNADCRPCMAHTALNRMSQLLGVASEIDRES